VEVEVNQRLFEERAVTHLGPGTRCVVFSLDGKYYAQVASAPPSLWHTGAGNTADVARKRCISSLVKRLIEERWAA
jgi:RecB family endonuclease NucS